MQNLEKIYFYKIKNDKLDLKHLDKAKSSEEAKDFVQQCLNKDFK